MAAKKEQYKSLELLAAYREQTRAEQNKNLPRKLIITLLVASIFIVLGVVYLMNYLTVRSLDAQLDDIEGQIAAIEEAEIDEGTEELNEQLETQLAYNDELKAHLEQLESVYRPESELFTAIERTGTLYGAVCMDIQYNDNIITLSCVAADSAKAAEFAKALENGLMDNVTFTGYTLVDDATYSFSVQGIREVQ